MELQHLGPEYVLAYQRACSDGSQSVYQTRVMLVGHFGAGKTSLKRRLVNEPFDVKYTTTNGIEADPSACKIVIDNTSNWRLMDRGKVSHFFCIFFAIENDQLLQTVLFLKV